MAISVVTLARLLLAVVFAAAGAAKLADLRGSRSALLGFGVSRRLAMPLGVLLPLAELVIAGALVPALTTPYAAAGALALLLLFAAAIGAALVRGRKPDCHCFGQLHSAPAGWNTLVRNAALGGLGVFVLSQPAATPSLFELATAFVIVVVAGQTLLSYKLLRRYGRALRRIDELDAAAPELSALEVGAPAPDFALPALGRGEVSLGRLLALARPVLLVFTDPDCGPCHALLPELSRWQDEYQQLTFAIVSRGEDVENAPLAEYHGFHTVLLQEDREVAELYGAYATPSAVLVGADGRIAHRLVAGASPIEKLVPSVAPALESAPEPASNGVARVATAAALGAGVAVAAAAAQASPGGADQTPSDPELQAIAAVLTAAAPRLVKASTRSANAVRAQATLGEGAVQRKKRVAAVRALAAERKEVLALRAKLAKLEPVGVTAHNVRVLTLAGLSLFARSLRTRERALVAKPKLALRLLEDSERLLLRSLPPLTRADELLERG